MKEYRANRTALIDYIDSYYSKDYLTVENIMQNVLPDDLDSYDDSDPKEGFYANMTTSELIKIKQAIQDHFEEPLEFSIQLSVDEYSSLLELLESSAYRNYDVVSNLIEQLQNQM